MFNWVFKKPTTIHGLAKIFDKKKLKVVWPLIFFKFFFFNLHNFLSHVLFIHKNITNQTFYFS